MCIRQLLQYIYPPIKGFDLKENYCVLNVLSVYKQHRPYTYVQQPPRFHANKFSPTLEIENFQVRMKTEGKGLS